MTREEAYIGGQKLQTYTDTYPETERDKVIFLRDFDIIFEDKDSNKQLENFIKLNENSKLYKAQLYMFVVSGHLYRPLPFSQLCGLKVKIKNGFGTRPQRF